MGVFKKGRDKVDKNKGLSEEQRLQVAELNKKRQESLLRLQANLEGFRSDYKELVLEYGIKLIPKIRFTDGGIFPYMVEQECREELDAYKKSQQERAKQESGVIKPDEPEEDGVIKH